jgi:5-oxoprolinase (ATP-hydrolysing)
VHRRLVTPAGAVSNYGVVVRPDFSVDEPATSALREQMRAERATTIDTQGYNRGGTIGELMSRCEEETGLKPPKPQWERNPYGPHTGLKYVREWYERMRGEGMAGWDKA